MKTRFIFNPCSGHNRRDPWLARAIPEFIAAQRLDADLVTTEGPGHATDLARLAVLAGCDRVIAVGGDGTLNEVAQALVNAPAALGLVPCGSGNGLALHLGIPTNPRRALALLADTSAREAAIDTGTANGHAFFNAMGVGFDAEIARRFNRLTRRGLPAYARTGLAAFLARRTGQYTITSGGRRESIEALLIAVANSAQYGNNAVIAPGARVDDGQLDLVAIRPVGLLGAAMLAARLFARRLDQSSRVMRRTGSRFVIQRTTSGLIHTDGETHETHATVEIAVLPRSLRLVVPRTARVTAPADAYAANFNLS